MKPLRSSLPGPARHLRDYLRLMRLMVGETRDQAYALQGQLERLTEMATGQAAELAQLREHVAALDGPASSRVADHAQVVEILRLLYERVAWRQERLRALRREASYEQAYAEADPLVSVVIPTYDNYELMRDRAIPSVLSQTYQNFEIVVVGDAAADEARQAAESFGDPRIRFYNLAYRGPYPENPAKLWLISGTWPFNEGVRQARGLWIAPLDDDDAFRPSHIERLVAHAREHRLELAYGSVCLHSLGGATRTIGRFPPEHGEINLQATVYHAGLAALFGLDAADAAFNTPNDWGWCQRLMEAGVRIGMVADEVTDQYPAREWTPRWENDEIPAEAQPEWEFVPEGWHRARDRPSIGWSAEAVARAYVAKWPEFVEAVTGPGPLGVGHEVPAGTSITRESIPAQNVVLAYAYALTRAAAGATTLSVLDWGGALGHYYLLARRLFPDLELEYHCRELPAVCREGRLVLPAVEFHDSDECLDRRYDLVVASSSLQYDEDWPARLRRLSGATGGMLFLTRVPIVRRAASFVTLQRAHVYGYDTEYLGWVFNREDLLVAAGTTGLALEREFTLTADWKFDGTPEAPSEAGFLFARADANHRAREPYLAGERA
jgi:putative methyltransferase (TIGR04325 family)